MLESEAWYLFLDEEMRLLVDEALYLRDREESMGETLFDYSFVVFPIAKAYEGFVKKFALEMGLLSEEGYASRRFRVGRSLNPAVAEADRDEWWIYGPLKASCGEVEGQSVADIMWQAWHSGRNRLFHYFPDNKEMIGLEDASARIDLFIEAMRAAVNCSIKSVKNETEDGD